MNSISNNLCRVLLKSKFSKCCIKSQHHELNISQNSLFYTYKTLSKKFIEHFLKNNKFYQCRQNFFYRKKRSNIIIALTLSKVYEFIGIKDEENQEIKKLLSKAKQVLEEGNLNEASQLYSSALKIALDTHDFEDIYFIKEKLAAISFVSRKYKDAETLFLEVKDYLMNKELKANILKFSYITLRLAEVYENMKDYKKAEEYYKISTDNLSSKLSEALQKKDKETIELWLLLLTSEAHYYLNRGMYDTAQKYFVKAYETSLQFRGELDERTVILLQQLGAVCFQKGDLELAVKYLKEAVHSGKHLPGLVELSNVYVTLGNIYLRQGLIKDAEILCNQGYKNAVRHKYEQGIKEATACLEELKEAIL